MTNTPPPPPSLSLRAAKYWPCFWASGSRYQHLVERVELPLLLAALCDVETECGESKLLDKKGPAGRGDKDPVTGEYHGHGLFQVDNRSHRFFLAKKNAAGIYLWTFPEENTEYAAQACLVPGFGIFKQETPFAVAQFNCGPRKLQRKLLELTDPVDPVRRFAVADSCTKKGTYVSRVAERYTTFGGKNFKPSNGGVA